MANFANLTAQLNLNIQDFAKNMHKASSMANQFSANLQGKINDGMVEPVKQSKFEFKDVARIVQGIIISKVFYSGLNAIRRATDAVWEFSKELEYAQMVYTNLFGDSKLATEFINVLMDFAAVTPFSFKQSEQAAKRLLAYGIEYQNIMYVMEGVLAAATVQGKDAIIEPISRAIGQIYTKGRLMNEEMRQLAEAGIPVYEILQEKLGLTAEELRNLGRTAVPANEAINAIIDGINERFGSTLKQANSTTTGILSNIKDNATMLIAGIFEPLTQHMKDGLADLGEFVGELRNIFEMKGLGGVFERIIPPELQESVKALIAQLKMLWDILKTNLGSVLSTFKYLLLGILQVFNAIGPAVMIVVGTFSALMKVITTNATLMKTLTTLILAGAMAWVVYKMQALAAVVTTAVIKGITKAVVGLITAFNFLVAHPVWALLAFGVGIFTALTGSSEKFRNSINNLYKSLFSMSGMDTSKMFVPSTKDRAADLDKFNDKLTETGKGMDDLKDKTEGAGKAAKEAKKGLLSFDEVFSLKDDKAAEEEKGEGEGEEGLPDLGDIGGLGGMDLSDMDFGIPNVGDIAMNFVDGLIKALGGLEELLSTAIGALLGSILGGILGGPLGAMIGALLGGLAGWLWPKIADALNLTDIGTVAIPLATMLGAIIGALMGGPMGALIGGAIGALVGWIIDAFARGFQQGDWSQVGKPLGLGIGAAIGYLLGGPMGALIGGAIGLLVGWVVDQITRGFQTGEWNVTGITTGLGALISGAIGMVVGGPMGAVIGASIGALVGWIVGKIVEHWSKITDFFSQIGDWFGGLGEGITTHFTTISASISEFFSDILTNVSDFFANAWGTVSSKASGILEPLVKGFMEGTKGAQVVLSDLFKGVSTVFNDIFIAIKTVGTDIWNAITTVGSDIAAAVTTVTTTVFNTVSGIVMLIFDLVVKILTDMFNAVSEQLQAVWQVFSDRFNAIWTVVSDNMSAVLTVITDILTEAWSVVSDQFQAMLTVVQEKLSAIWKVVSDQFQNVYQVVSEKVSAVYQVIAEQFTEMLNIVTEMLSGIYDSVKTIFVATYNSIKTSISDMYNTIKEGTANMYNVFTDWVSDLWTNVFDKLFGWIDDAVVKLRDFFKLDEKAKSTPPSTSHITRPTTSFDIKKGHATGGVFNREHIARFAEGNKSEAIIPLENESAMRPFVDAVSNGLTASLAPILATFNSGQSQNDLRPLYVGTLIADERGLKELNRKMQVIQLEESARRG